MYKVLIDGEILSWYALEETALVSATLTLEANKAGTFVFSMPPSHPFYNALVFRQSLIDVYQDADLIFEGVPVTETTDFDNVKTVTCEGELTFLNDTIQRPAKYSNQTVTSLLTAYLTNHNADCDAGKTFQLGTVTVNGGSALSRYTNYESTMQEIAEDLVNDLGGYLRVRHHQGVRYLDYLAASPHTSSQIIKIGQNLLDFSKNYDSTDICTVLIPLGAAISGQQTVAGIDDRVDIKSVNGGLDYIVSTASGFYGNVWRTVSFDGINDPSTLLSTATAYLSDAQWANMVIEASAVDLGLVREDVEQFRILDEIRVVSAPHNLDRYFILTKLVLDLNDPANTTITLGEETVMPLSAASARNSAAIQTAATDIQVVATDRARELLENATGGCVYFRYDANSVLYEIDIMNTNDPNTATKIWRWNINGWGYSDDGGATYTLAATMDGEIDANFIKTGTLDASVVNVTNLNASNISTGALTVKDWQNNTLFNADKSVGAVQICGFTVSSNSIQYGTFGTANSVLVCSGTSTAKSIGGSASISGWSFTAGADFGVTNTGELYASSATIQGTVTATGGSIAGWSIAGNKISSNSGNTYISSDTSDYAFKATNTVIAHNGDISTQGNIILNSSGAIKLGNDAFIYAASGVAGRIGYNSNFFILHNSNNGITMCLNGTQYTLSVVGGVIHAN